MKGFVYSITNKVNGKRYIGRTIHFESRVKAILYDEDSPLNDEIDKYGLRKFKLEKLYETEGTRNEIFERLKEKEREFITQYDTINNGYNKKRGNPDIKNAGGNRKGQPTKKVIQMDLEGNVVGRYDSLTEASKKNNVKICDISRCCHKYKKTAGGYRWALA